MTSLKYVWLHNGQFARNPIARQVVQVLVEQGAEVVVVDRAAAFRLRDVPAGAVRHRQVDGGDGATILLRYFAAVVAERPDVVIASHPAVGWAGQLGAAISRARFIYYMWELYGEEDERDRRNRIIRYLEKLVLRRAETTIAPSEEIAAVYVAERGLDPSKLVVVHNWAESARPVETGPVRALVRPEAKILLYTGALMQGRCLEIMPEVLAAADPSTVFVAVGSDVPAGYWDRHISPKVVAQAMQSRMIRLGWVESDSLAEYAAGCDVGVILYSRQPRGNFLCTASRLGYYLAADVPVVVPPYPYIARIVRQYGIGHIVADTNAREVATGVEAVLRDDPATWRARFEVARQQLSWDAEKGKLRKIFA